MTNYWLIRIGEGGRFSDIARKHNYAAIGWNEINGAEGFKNRDQVRDKLQENYPEYSKQQLAVQVGQVSRFILDIEDGDIVVSPNGDGTYDIGALGELYFEPSPTDGCTYKNRRKVNWFDQKVSKDDASSNLSFALGSSLTVYSLNKYAPELSSLITGEEMTPAEKPQTVKQAIKEGLLELGGEEFEHFIEHILSLVGFTDTEVTQYSGDKGIDVVGVLEVDGLVDINLRVQVKRVRGSISNKEILSIRGASEQGERPCLITLSTFTKQAKEEAEAPGKIPVKLIDGNDLASLVLKYFDEIDDNYKRLFQIKRKRDFNIDDQFEILGSENDDAADDLYVDLTTTDKYTNNKSYANVTTYDTLVCSAKEDGFKTAFLEQEAWWAIRLGEKARTKLKYIAMYQIAPISAITYVAEIVSVEPFGDKGKYKLYLENIEKLDTPIVRGENPNLKPQGPKFALMENIRNAKTLDDVFGK